MLQGTIDRLIEIGRSSGMETSVGKITRLMRISRHTFPVQIVRDRKRLENLKSFTYLGRVITKGARCVGEINSRITREKKAVFIMTKTPLTNKLNLN